MHDIWVLERAESAMVSDLRQLQVVLHVSGIVTMVDHCLLEVMRVI